MVVGQGTLFYIPPLHPARGLIDQFQIFQPKKKHRKIAWWCGNCRGGGIATGAVFFLLLLLLLFERGKFRAGNLSCKNAEKKGEGKGCERRDEACQAMSGNARQSFGKQGSAFFMLVSRRVLVGTTRTDSAPNVLGTKHNSNPDAAPFCKRTHNYGVCVIHSVCVCGGGN